MTTTASAVKLPFSEAVEYFRQKTNMPTTHWTEVMDEAHARSFVVAGAAKDALVQDFREAVHKAISEGTGLTEFRKDFDEIVEKHGWAHTGTAGWRAKVIYQTNMSTAYAAGRYAQMTQPDVLAAFPYWEYLHVNCPNPRLQHLAWSGMVLRADDPFWATNYPPNGWGCHCLVASVNDRGLARMGKTGPDPSPRLQWQEYVDRTTGRVTKYPTGVDPGFAYNPGQAWKDGAKQVVKTPSVRPAGAAPPVLAQPGKTAVTAEVLKVFLEKPVGAVQIGELAPVVVKRLEAKSRTALLSAATLKKQGINHPELSAEAYEALDGIFARPLLVLDAGRARQVWIFGAADGAVLRATVKTAQDGQENYVVSLHQIGAASMRLMVKKAKVVAGSVTAVQRRLGK